MAIRLCLFTALALGIPNLREAGAQVSPERIHRAVAGIIAERAIRPLPTGDTLVSWYKQNPTLFHLVARSPAGVTAAMMRGDGYLGTSEVDYASGHPSAASALWTSGDSQLVNLEFTVGSDSLLVTGTRSATFPLPKDAWGIADYGLEDLLLPVLVSLAGTPQPWHVVAYRPFPGKWDTLTVTSKPVDTATLFTLSSSDKSKDVWLVSATGALIRMLREGQDFERRPLENTPLWKEYERLMSLMSR